MEKLVIDVSEHQGNIDWAKVKNAQVAGAMVRCGYGVKSPSQVDRQFYHNLSGCQAVGMPYGFYHYSYAMSAAEAEQEAELLMMKQNCMISVPMVYVFLVSASV